MLPLPCEHFGKRGIRLRPLLWGLIFVTSLARWVAKWPRIGVLKRCAGFLRLYSNQTFPNFPRHWLGDHFQPQLGDSGAKVLPTADAEVKAPHGLPSKSSTCGKTAALRTRVFHSLNFILIVYYIIDINCFILFILLSIDLSPCLIFLIDGIDVVLLFGVKLEHVGTTLRYPFTHIYHFRLTASPSAGSVGAGTSRWLWSMGEEVEWWSSSLRVAHTASIWSPFGKMPVTSGQNRARSGKMLWESMKMIADFLWGRWIFKRKIEKIQAEFMKIHGQSSGMITWFGNQLDANGLEDSVRWEQKECYGENWAEGKDHDECMKEGIHSFPTVRFFSNLACRCL